MTAIQRPTLEEFLATPDTEPASEYVCGEVLQKAMPTNAHGLLQGYIAMLLFQHLSAGRTGRIRTAWTCIFGPPGRERALVPDALYVSYERMPPAHANEYPYLRTAPDLAVEILSPDESVSRFAGKLRFYLSHGVRIVWVIDPDDETIGAYTPGDSDERVLRPGDTLDGGDVLPGFTASVAEIMAELRNG